MNVKLIVVGLLFLFGLPICIANAEQPIPELQQDLAVTYPIENTNTQTATLAYLIGLGAVGLTLYKAKPTKRFKKVINN